MTKYGSPIYSCPPPRHSVRCACGLCEIGTVCPYCSASIGRMHAVSEAAPDLVGEFDAMAKQSRVAREVVRPRRKRRTKAELAAAKAEKEARLESLTPDWLQGWDAEIAATVRTFGDE